MIMQGQAADTVKLDGISFPPEYQRFLESLEKLGFENATMFGGALRDHYLGIPEKIKDWDTMANFPKPSGSSALTEDTERMVRDILSQTKEVTDISPEVQVNSRMNTFRISFKYNGREVDLIGFDGPSDRAALILGGDAPINSIRMNAKGEIFSHPDFIGNADARVYAPFPGNLGAFGMAQDQQQQAIESRFNKLREKIPDLRMQSGDQKFVSAQEQSDGPVRPSKIVRATSVPEQPTGRS